MAESKNICRTKTPFSDLKLMVLLGIVLCSLFTPSTSIKESSRSSSLARTGAIKVLALRPRRALDILESDDFGGFRKRALDGDGFGSFEKRALDTLEGDDFMGLKRKRLNVEGDGFMGLDKRALDILDGDDFTGFSKRSEVNGGLRRELALLGKVQRQRQMRARRALDALEGNSFGFRR